MSQRSAQLQKARAKGHEMSGIDTLERSTPSIKGNTCVKCLKRYSTEMVNDTVRLSQIVM